MVFSNLPELKRRLLASLLIATSALIFAASANSAPSSDKVAAECEEIEGQMGREAAIGHWTELAVAGDAKAQFCLGLSIRITVWIGPKDDKEMEARAIAANREAMDWIKRAAEQGFFAAQEDLAAAYLFGRDGIEQNWEMALQWMQKSAAQGSPTAHLSLGSWYSGWPFSDKQKAYRHLRLGIEILKLDNPEQAYAVRELFGLDIYLGELLDTLTEAQRSDAEAWIESELLKLSAD